MANQFLTLKDVTSLDHLADPASVGLVDNIVNVAPELERVLGRPIPGISYEDTILTAIGSNAAFRNANSGVPLSAPSIDTKRFSCMPFDCQNRVDEAILEARASQGESPAFVFETIATANARQKAIRIGRQFYQGSLNDAKGPPGLIDFLTTSRTQVDSRTGKKIDQAIDAGGSTSAACEIIWFIKQGPQGVHWLFGNGRGIYMNPWRPQQVLSPDATANTPLYNLSWCSNTFGYIGTSMANYHAVGAIINVDVTNGTTTANGLWDDKVVAKLWAKFPITEKPDLAFCTQNAAAALQQQRTVTNFVTGGNRGGTEGMAPIADFPTRLPTAGNIPLIVTDSIQLGNQLVLS